MSLDFLDTDNPDYPVKVRYDAAAGGDPLQPLGDEEPPEPIEEPKKPLGPYRSPA